MVRCQKETQKHTKESRKRAIQVSDAFCTSRTSMLSAKIHFLIDLYQVLALYLIIPDIIVKDAIYFIFRRLTFDNPPLWTQCCVRFISGYLLSVPQFWIVTNWCEICIVNTNSQIPSAFVVIFLNNHPKQSLLIFNVHKYTARCLHHIH